MNESIWSKTVQFPERPPLPGDLTADAAVIGGGLAGVLTAHFLKGAGLRVVVLEESRVGSGQTKNTTAKITSQHGLIYHRLLEQIGEERARQYAEANQRAIEEYRTLIAERRMECDFAEAPAYLYSTAERESLEQEFKAARLLGIDAALCDGAELPFPVAAALRFDRQARFHPMKFLRTVAEPLEIYERTAVQSVEGNRLQTDRGTVTARHIVFATHYPFLNVPGYYFMRMHQERSYVLALENAAQLAGMYLGIDEDGLSLRPQGDLLLLGGGNHRTGENSAGGQYRKLREAARRYWPESREAAAWSAQDCMTLDGVPYIGRFSSSTPNWYVATGFQKWGMTSSMVSALLLTDLIVKGESPWEAAFTPQRFEPTASAKALMQETAQATKGLARKLFTPPRADIEALPNGHGGVVEYDGDKVGVYKDNSGEVFIVSIRCPHLGCQLEWNPDEKSWDCPCHGSRFDYRGNLIDNPAQKGLEHE
ncbi:FAD-dependent oxidoreductase [Ligaoa zhengdingensis]|uniref:FAD-dependent oxidoreductase n=1 Tax=Ligaoa zhengdingensis TaxID=2763658 RepID=UPI0031B9BF39